MNYSPLAEALVKAWEKCRLKAYQDDRGVWTIGWGTTTGAVPGVVVKPGMTCTQDQADAWLDAYLTRVAGMLNAQLAVALHQNQFDALVSMFYNVGLYGFERSKLRARLNAGDPAAADEMLDWCYETKNGERVRSKGLETRRKSEYALFHTAAAA